MAWEDRTPAEQAQADQAAAAYRDTDDDRDYAVVTDRGTRLQVHGINSARVLAGRGGTILYDGPGVPPAGVWRRAQPKVAPGGDCDGDGQVSDAFNARWQMQLPTGEWALITRSFYVENPESAPGFLQLTQDTEYLVCTDPNDPGSTEISSAGAFEQIRLAGLPTEADARRAARDARPPSTTEWFIHGPAWAQSPEGETGMTATLPTTSPSSSASTSRMPAAQMRLLQHLFAWRRANGSKAPLTLHQVLAAQEATVDDLRRIPEGWLLLKLAEAPISLDDLNGDAAHKLTSIDLTATGTRALLGDPWFMTLHVLGDRPRLTVQMLRRQARTTDETLRAMDGAHLVELRIPASDQKVPPGALNRIPDTLVVVLLRKGRSFLHAGETSAGNTGGEG